jgi:hypothetical protein
MITVTTTKATIMTAGVHQRRLDLGLDGFRLFHVGGKTVQQRFQNTGGLAGLHQIAVEAVEIQRKLAKGGAQRGAGFHIGADVVEQLGDAGVGVATAHDVERLQQRHAGLHHGGQLAGEQRNVLGLDLLAAAGPALLDLGRSHALAAQHGLDLVFSAGTSLAANDLAVAVLAFPLEEKFLDSLGRCACHGVPH